MGSPTIRMDGMKIIGAVTPEFERFMTEWRSPDSYIIAHTSGSTGNPKEIRLMKSDMIKSAKNTCDFLGLNCSSRVGLPLSVDYIAGKMMVVRALISCSTLWIEQPSMNPLQEYNSHEQIDLLSVVPSQLSTLITSEAYRKVNNLLIGGAPLSADMEDWLIDLGIKGFVTYGMTETCSHVALREIGSDNYRALNDISFSADEDNRLVIECPSYTFKRVKTNDMVRLIDEKTFQWLGRKDNVINSGGIKLHPEEIEKKLSQILKGENYYITSRISSVWGEEIILMVERENELSGLYDQIKKVLSRYEIPKKIIYNRRFDRTSSGKIIRHKL